MVQRAEREPTMEEIVVALRETRRGADRMPPFAVAEQSRGKRTVRGMVGSTDLADLRDGEIERLLAENARLNARVVALLKVLEHEQACNAETAAESTVIETDREAIYREVRAALEAELGPILLILLRLLEKQRAEPATGNHHAIGEAGRSTAMRSPPSEWIVDLMHKLDSQNPAPDETAAMEDAMPRRAKLRERLAEILNAFRLDPIPASPRRFTSPEGRH